VNASPIASMLGTGLLAAEGASPVALEVLPAVTSAVVFLVVLGFLYVKVWPIITKGLDERNAKIIGEIEAAEEARRQAKAAQAEFEKKLNEAREEATKIVAQSRAEGQRQAEVARAKMEQELQERLQRATAEIDGAKRQAIMEVHDQAVSLAAQIAGQILKREIKTNPGDQQKLVEESLQQLAGSRN